VKAVQEQRDYRYLPVDTKAICLQGLEKTSAFPSIVFGTGRSTLPSESPGIGKKRKVMCKAQAQAKSTVCQFHSCDLTFRLVSLSFFLLI
jgi:hypothetical protein